ncbi:MAG: GNAT family N-acetyltransferase [Candidatus Thorarchaeota archaeon]|nr:GNAT family N-acetyltransferase [Candidatus Thorarchaeota archaeon]
MIETDRLILRAMKDGDFNGLLKIFTDKKVMKSFNSQAFSREQMRNWINRNLEHQEEYG